jgi:hypothetical protein
VHFRLAEAARESEVLVGRETWRAHEHDPVLEQSVVDAGERGIVEVVELDPVDSCPERGCDWFDLELL